VAIANRKVVIGTALGYNTLPMVDYRIDGVTSSILLYTADLMTLTKGRRNKITLNATVRPLDGRVVAVKVNPVLYEDAMVSCPTWIDSTDSGVISLIIAPKTDIDLSEVDYICKILVEGAI